MSVPVSPSTVSVGLRGGFDESHSRSCRLTGEFHLRFLTMAAVACRPVILAPRRWPLPDRCSRRPGGEQKCLSRPSVPAHARKVAQ